MLALAGELQSPSSVYCGQASWAGRVGVGNTWWGFTEGYGSMEMRREERSSIFVEAVVLDQTQCLGHTRECVLSPSTSRALKKLPDWQEFMSAEAQHVWENSIL